MIKPIQKRWADRKSLWTALDPGDVVDIVAPASSSTDRDLRGALRFVEDFGLTPRLPHRIFGPDVVCSNSDINRWKHLKKALQAKDSKAIWCLRGGYGSLRLLRFLSQMKPPCQTKLFIGYSDLTTLHGFFNQFWGWPTVHGSMLEELGRGEGGQRELHDFRQLLFGHRSQMEYGPLTPMNAAARKKGVIRSSLVGGNLTVLQSCLGTPWQFSTKGKILVVEDIGERGYRIDRILVHMEQAGFLKGTRAIIFGDFVGGGEPDDSAYLWKEVQARFAKESKIPVLKGLPFGHVIFQRPTPFFTRTELKLGRQPRMIVQSGCAS